MTLFANITNGVDQVLDGLNPPQKEAVRHEGGPLLVLAGAGSGKTRVLTRRVAWLIARGIPPYRILAVTFTNKAAGEMKERIATLVGPRARDAWIGTFHSIGVRILRREAERAGIAKDFSIFDRDDQISALRRVLAELSIPPKENPPEQILSVISKAKNDLLDPDAFEESVRGPWERLVARVYRGYAASLRAQSSVDFDDLLMLPVKLLRDEETRLRYAQQFAHVLVDEYQDTNRCQYEFLRALTKDHRRLFVVGDDDQSIYRWRGADLANILDFEKDHPDAHVIRLEQNYRSTEMILKAANSLIRNNVSRKGKELWTEKAGGEVLLALEVTDEQAEAMAVLRFVKDGLREERSPSDFAILYRTNAQSRALENAFQLAQVPYQVFGGQRFYERKEIKDTLAYLRLLVNPADDVAMTRVINVPTRGVGKKTLEDLRADATARGDSLLAAAKRAVAGQGAELRPAVRTSLADFLEILSRATERAHHDPVADVTEDLLKDVGYEQYLEEEDEPRAVSRQENIAELLTGMQEFADTEGREDKSVAAFLQEVSLLTDVDELDENAPRVTLMTLHNAKGLEFPWVFITGLEEGLFPHANSIEEPAGLEEERRLFYVGMTRARERVVLLNAEARRRYDGYYRSMPSRFLDEIDPELVERRSLAGAVRGWAGAESDRAAAPRPPTFTRRAATWGDAGERDMLPRYEDESQASAELTPGMRVKHPSWGEGIVEAVEGAGERLKLTIRFRGGILKKVLAVYAKLELLG